MVVDIPFAFVAGNATLPAGEYRVQKLDGHSGVLFDSLLGRECVSPCKHPSSPAK